MHKKVNIILDLRLFRAGCWSPEYYLSKRRTFEKSLYDGLESLP